MEMDKDCLTVGGIVTGKNENEARNRQEVASIDRKVECTWTLQLEKLTE